MGDTSDMAILNSIVQMSNWKSEGSLNLFIRNFKLLFRVSRSSNSLKEEQIYFRNEIRKKPRNIVSSNLDKCIIRIIYILIFRQLLTRKTRSER